MSQPRASLASDGLTRNERYQFRLMAEYQHHPEVAALIDAGSSRRQVLLAINRIRGCEPHPAPTYTCATCGHEVERT